MSTENPEIDQGTLRGLEGFARKKLAGSRLNPEDAADLVSDAVLVFLEKAGAGERVEKPFPFLCGIVENLVAKNFEIAGRFQLTPLTGIDVPAGPESPSTIPERARRNRIPDSSCPPIWLELEGPRVDETGNVLAVETLSLGVADREAARPAVRLVNLASAGLERKQIPPPLRGASLTWFAAAELPKLPGILRAVWGTGPLDLEPGAPIFHRKFSQIFRESIPAPTFRRPGERGDEKKFREGRRQGLALAAALFAVPGGGEAVQRVVKQILGFVAGDSGATDPGTPFRLFPGW